MHTTSQDFRTFLAAAFRSPAVVGAVAPSSAALADLLASVVPRQGAPVVVELGPGTGAVSAAIARRLPPGARHLAVEVNPTLASHLRESRPNLEVLLGDAADLADLLPNSVSRVDAVVSGLPWALFEPEQQRRILDQIGQVLAPGGGFSTFGYLHALPLAGARRFHRMLNECFDEVIPSRVVWRNLPPAMAYVCRRPVSCVLPG